MRVPFRFRNLRAALLAGLICTSANGDVLKEAHVSQVVKDVQLLQSNGTRAASTTDVVRQGTAVRTGAESRAELTFTDLTIARMGANTIFSFDEGTRTVDLSNGAILLRVPKDSGGAKVRTAAVTAAITGTTVLVEYHKNAYAKFITLEGTMRVYLKGHLGESVLLRPGQMMIVNPNATHLPDPVDVDLERLIHTSLLITGFPPLGSETFMANAQLDQLGKKAAGTLIDTNLVIFGRGTLVTLADPTSLDVVDQARAASPTPSPEPTRRPTATPTPIPVPTATPTPPPSPTPTPVPTATPSPTPVPTPSKFGTPTIITSFIPYPIDNGTVIQTDPAITRAGVTDFGKIYRDPTQDGPFSAWAFGATSAFDTSSGFDNQFFATTGNVPMAVFKFANLMLSGNPTVTLANGGVSNLGLVSVLGITATPAGDTTFTFSGMHTVLLAAQNGSIQLSGISFANINTLIMYARGTGSNILLGAPVTGVTQLRLYAEGDIRVDAEESVTAFRAIAGNDFLSGSGPILARSVFISAQRDVNFTGSQFAVGDSTGNTLTLGAGRNLNIDITNDQTVFTNAAAVTLNGTTINIVGGTNPATLDFGTGADNINAGTGGLQAPTIAFQHASYDASTPNLALNIRSAGDINVYSISDANIVQASGLINASDFIGANTITAGQSITTGTDLIAANSITAGTTINVGGLLLSPLVTAGGNITASAVEVLTINAPSGILTAGSGGISPYLSAGPGAQHQFTVSSITSPNGITFSGNQYVLNGYPAPQPGGYLTINANTLTFDSASGISVADFSGSDATSTTNSAGSGGTLITNTTGDTTVNSVIVATTGIIPNNGTFSGAGGTVSLNSSAGAITVNGTINVSSDDLRYAADVAPANVRESASGGDITLHSDLTTGTGITIGSDAQVTSYLNSQAPGPGGSILLSTKGADIVVSGNVEADRGTVTMSQSDPPGQVPIISIDNATLVAATLNVHSAGNLNIAQAGPVTLNVSTISLVADLAINWQVDSTTLGSLVSLTVNAPTISLTGGTATAPATFNLVGADNFNAGISGVQAPTVILQHASYDPNNAAQSLNIRSGGDIRLQGILGANLVQAAGVIDVIDSISAYAVTAGQSVTVGGDLITNSTTAGTTINVGGDFISVSATAGGNITADYVSVLNITAPNGILMAGTGGIHPYLAADPGAAHQFTVDSIVSPNGIDFSGNNYVLAGSAEPQTGGKLTINATTLTFDKGGIAFADLSGSDAVTGKEGGSGGIFTTTTSGDTLVNAPISATTGLMPSNGNFSGAGGSVSLNSTGGAITVNNTIEVSSDDLSFNPSPTGQIRESSSGGSITLHSDLTTGTGITINSGAQLLSLLNARAPGPGGSILLSTKGADIVVNGGQLQADRGTVTISQNDPVGMIRLDDAASVTAETLSIFGSGNITLGSTAAPTTNAVTVTIDAPLDILGYGLSLNSVASDSSGDYSITAGDNITLSGNVSLSHSSGTASSDINTTFSAGNTLNIAGGLYIQGAVGEGQPGFSGSGANVSVSSGGDTTIGGDPLNLNLFELATSIGSNSNSGGNIDVNVGGSLIADTYFHAGASSNLGSGLNIALATGGDIRTVTGEGRVAINTSVVTGATVGTGANITLRAGGDMVASSAGGYDLELRNTGTITSGGNIDAAIAGNLSTGGLFTSINNVFGTIGTGGNVTWSVAGDAVVEGDATFSIVNSQIGTSGGNIGSAVSVDIRANSFTVGQGLSAYVDNSDGSIGPGGNDFTLTLQSTHAISVGGILNVYGTITAGGDVTAGTVRATNVTTTGVIAAGSGGIQPFRMPLEPQPDIPHVLTASRVTSQGGINFDGPSQLFGFGPFVGGTLTLNVNSFSIGASNADVIGTASFNGGDAPTGTLVAGQPGGSFTVNSAGDVTVDSTIEATTGIQDYANAPSGTGGTVDLRSSGGTVAVSSRVQVSSAEFTSSTPRRRSNAGGRINLQSNASGTTASRPVAINVTSSAQLLSLLDAAATGPGGKITIKATGVNSDLNVNGTVRADRGEIDIRHTGDGGHVTLGGTMSADVIKAAALGSNGTLNIGGGSMSATSLLYLYSTGSNGQLNFVANCTLSSGSAIHLAANSITIQPAVVVTISGASGQANVYTNNANYAASSGGNGTTTGTFGGNGAKTPQLLSSAPPLPSPPPGP